MNKFKINVSCKYNVKHLNVNTLFESKTVPTQDSPAAAQGGKRGYGGISFVATLLGNESPLIPNRSRLNLLRASRCLLLSIKAACMIVEFSSSFGSQQRFLYHTLILLFITLNFQFVKILFVHVDWEIIRNFFFLMLDQLSFCHFDVERL